MKISTAISSAQFVLLLGVTRYVDVLGILYL